MPDAAIAYKLRGRWLTWGTTEKLNFFTVYGNNHRYTSTV